MKSIPLSRDVTKENRYQTTPPPNQSYPVSGLPHEHGRTDSQMTPLAQNDGMCIFFRGKSETYAEL